MATLVIQRATSRLNVLGCSRSFTASSSTALPYRQAQPYLSSGPRPFQILRASRIAQPQSPFATAAAVRAEAAVSSSGTAVPKPDIQNLSAGLDDQPLDLEGGDQQVDWARSFHGLSMEAFPKEAAEILMAPIPVDDIEVKPDGIIYLPEIKYRRILNKAFGPGAWGLAPRGETIVTAKAVTREYALVVLGRLVSVARGEQDYFSTDGIPTAAEGCKSNALLRCCKDLGIASELWDPRFIRKFNAAHVKDAFVEHVVTRKTKKIYLRKDDKVSYPFKEKKGFGG